MKCSWVTGMILVAATTAAGCSSATTSAPKATVPLSPGTTASGPLQAPKTTPAMDGSYLENLAAVDPTLATYLTSDATVASQALLTDGSAFCAFLKRGGGIDNAMASLVIGANGVEAQTHLPASVTTYNAIDAVALISLCPDEQSLLPASSRSHVEALSQSLHSSSVESTSG